MFCITSHCHLLVNRWGYTNLTTARAPFGPLYYTRLPIGGNAAHDCLLICASPCSLSSFSSAQLIRIDCYVSVKLVRCSSVAAATEEKSRQKAAVIRLIAELLRSSQWNQERILCVSNVWSNNFIVFLFQGKEGLIWQQFTLVCCTLDFLKRAEEVLGVISIDRFARACLCRASLSI